MVDNFNEEEARSIKETQELMRKESVRDDLAFIKCHLSFLPVAITRLEQAGLSLCDSLALLEDVKAKINSIPSNKGKIFKDKMEQVLKKNSNLEILQDVAKIQSGMPGPKASGWAPDEVAELKYCPLTSVDVERSFSVYKHIFSDRRHKFKEENLEKIVITNCYYSREQ